MKVKSTGQWHSVFGPRLNIEHLLPKLAALFLVLAAMFTVAGWAYFPELMRSSHPWVAQFHPVTAIGLVFVGLSLRLSRWEGFNHRLSRFSVLLRLGISGAGALILATHRGWFNPGAAGASWPGDAPDNWPSEAAGCGLMLLGVTVFLKHARRHLTGSQIILGIVSLLSLTGLLADLYGANGAGSGLLMEPGPAFLMLLAASTLLYLQSSRGPLGEVVADSLGGAVARRLLPASILVPIGLGWLRMVGEAAGWLNPSFGLLIHVLASIAIMAAIVWHSATMVARTSVQGLRVNQQFLDVESSYQSLLHLIAQPVFAFNNNGDVTYINRTARTLFAVESGDEPGLTVAQLLGEHAWEHSLAPHLLGLAASSLKAIPIQRGGHTPFHIEAEGIRIYRTHRQLEMLVIIRSAQADELDHLGLGAFAAIQALRPVPITAHTGNRGTP